ncbi:hypothetical protein [Parashewanella tropica]|uniref:hypothetical protein n=1 Tax=Parashewanella tropica TaxID=2547970 RepID=UPI001059F7A2|nr:hypothetical protein [Parashewanella tropica]
MANLSVIASLPLNTSQLQAKELEDDGYHTGEDAHTLCGFEAKAKPETILNDWHQAEETQPLPTKAASKGYGTVPSISESKQASVKPHYPRNSERWLRRAHHSVSPQNPALTLLLDLDETSFVAFEFQYQLKAFLAKNTRFTEESAITCPHKGETVLFFIAVDAKALRAVSKFQQRGHKVAIVTAGCYLFDAVANLFSSYGVTLSEDLYFNRSHLPHLNKAKFINEKLMAKNDCLLIDDLEENRPQKAFFSLADQHHFPLHRKHFAAKGKMTAE